MVNTIAVIPARGGSKRIPHKNIIGFLGKPMIEWSIRAALESELFDRVLVSTDDPDIANISISAGAEVPFLRSEYAGDHSTASEATISCLRQAEDYFNETYTDIVQLMPNCPLRGVQEILNSWSFYTKGSHSFQISAFEFGWMNPWWAAKLNNESEPSWIFPEALSKRSQDLDKLYCPTGAIWIANVNLLKEFNTFYGPGHKFCPINWRKALDIDDTEDLDMATIIANSSCET